MDKRMLFLFGWITNVILLFSIIVMPKDSKLYSVLYQLTMYLIFAIPLFLIVFQDGLMLKRGYNIDIYCAISNIGCTAIILLTFIKFVKSIEIIGRAQIITILCVFVALELLIGYLKIAYRKMSKKQYLFLEAATYVSLVVFFFCAMIMSFDFGII